MSTDQMPAGPELDACVAEKIMGWHGAGLKAAEVGVLWCPSSNIAHAWEVLETLRARGIKLSIHSAKSGYDVEYFPGQFESAATASLAISRAALKAVGE